MVVLSGADVVLPDRILSPGTVVFDDDRIIDVLPGGRARDGSSIHFDLRNHYIVPGFIDVHVHGAEGRDTLDGREAIASIARLLPRYGTTAFCPTTIACSPMALRGVLKAVRDARLQPISGAARVLAAHIESNFLNPAFKGAQPLDCLRLPPTRAELADAFSPALDAPDPGALYDACAILHEIERARPDVGIVTLAPELPDAIGLVQTLVGRGIRVSAGHSGATFDQGVAAISAGVRHA
ncbi:MAG: amidohydrolase family protein, partial [Acidobacteria bacterium]|nr:amidohydrolase family protein [Acidobacteriota bacterium]